MIQQSPNFYKNIEQYWNCPITKGPIQQPVTTSDGHTYQRQAIQQWFLNSEKSPKTGLRLSSTQLFPNLIFKQIKSFLTSNLWVQHRKQGQQTLQIQQLKQQIQGLKQLLNQYKSRNQEAQQHNQLFNRTKIIEKKRYQQKISQLSQFRQMKNKFQRQIHELSSKQEQQNRQIHQLQQQLKEVSAKYQFCLSQKKKLQINLREVRQNRIQAFDRVKYSFISNFRFIGHFLQAIEAVKKFEKNLHTRNNIKVQTTEGAKGMINCTKDKVQEQKQNKKLITEILQENIRKKINGEEQNSQSQYQMSSQMIRRQGYRQPNNIRMQVANERIVPRHALEIASLTFPQQQDSSSQQSQVGLEQHSSLSVQTQAKKDTQIYEQLNSVKWLMSKRYYKQIPIFYRVHVWKINEESDTFAMGIKLTIRDSQIPFADFLGQSWEHVKFLDLFNSNVDDQLWKKFTENGMKFSGLIDIDLSQNRITTVVRADLNKFMFLKKVNLQRNKLTKQSIEELKQYALYNQKLKVQYSEEQQMESQSQNHMPLFPIFHA